MFYGAVVKPGVDVVPKTSDGGEILHLSQACLASGGDAGPVYLMAETSKKEKFALCALTSQSTPQALLDLFFSTATEDIKLSVKGKGEIHVAGYFEPPEEEEDEFDEKEDEDSEVEALQKNGKVFSGSSVGRKSTDVEDELGLDDDDDEDEEEDEAEIEDDKDGDLSTGQDDDEEDEDEDSDEEEMSKPSPLQMSNAKGKKKAVMAPQQQQNQQAAKRKKPSEQAGGPSVNDAAPAKKAKGGGGGGGDMQKFEKDVEVYLRKNGRTPLASLGSQVKKPPGVEKLGQFMRERPSKFVVENGHVSLK